MANVTIQADGTVQVIKIGEVITGPPGPQGIQGEPGKSLRYEDLTPTQKAELKGPKGEPGNPGAPGKDGKSLRYEDLTEQQKAELKGAKGDPGTTKYSELEGKPDLSVYELKSENVVKLNAKLDKASATPNPTPDTIAQRDAYGRLQVANPVNNQDAVSRYYHENSEKMNWGTLRTQSQLETLMVGTLCANRLAMLPPEQVKIEKSTDGNTWVDAGISDNVKSALLSGSINEQPITFPKTNWMRITLSSYRPNNSVERYCRLNKLFMRTSTQGGNLQLKIEKGTNKAPDSYVTVSDFNNKIANWPGSVFVNFEDHAFGGPWDNGIRNLRLTLRITDKTDGNWYIARLAGFGSEMYESTVPLARNGQVWQWDEYGNPIINGVTVTAGVGSPEGKIIADVGSTYTDKSATNGAIRWIKKTGGNSANGWAVEYGDTGWRNITPNPLPANIDKTDCKIRRINDVVEVAIGYTNVINATEMVYTSSLPLGFRPAQNVFVTGISTGPGTSRTGGVAIDGTRIRWQSTVGNWRTAYARYTTDDAWPATLPGA